MIFVGVFLISLQSLYFYSVNLPLYSVAGVVVLFCCALMNIALSRHFGAISISRAFIVQVAAPFAMLFLSLITFFIRFEAEYSRIFAFLTISLVPLSYSLLASRIDPISLVTKLLVIHSSVFFAQFALFFGFGIDFDPVNILSEVEQRGWGGSLQHDVLGSFRRLGGLYSEPGTYATFVAPLVAMLFAHSGDNRKQRYAIIFGLLSLMLTFSIFAWVFSSIIVAMMFVTSLRRFFIILPIVPLIFCLAWPYVEYRFLGGSASNISSGLDFREDITQSTFDFFSESFANALFGIGLLTYEIPFSFYGAINDIGLFLFALLSSGVIGTLFIVMIVFNASWRFGFIGTTIALILLLSKISIFAPMFWLILVMSTHLSMRPAQDATRSVHSWRLIA